MKKQNRIVLAASIAIAALLLYPLLKASIMTDIKFDIGKNIVDTARASGVQKFVARDVDGYISYSVNDLLPDVKATFSLPGHEVTFESLFAFTMYADKANNNNLGVENVTLQFSPSLLTDHQSGKRFAEGLIDQMQKRNWSRYVDGYCPAVTGRSSLMNEYGELENIGDCGLDPSYKLTMEEWVQLMKMGQRYKWIADGVLASLRVGYSTDSRGITYLIFLEFDDLSIKSRKDAEHQARDLSEGDAKGWNSSADYADGIKKRNLLMKLLEANAVKRGDAVIKR